MQAWDLTAHDLLLNRGTLIVGMYNMAGILTERMKTSISMYLSIVKMFLVSIESVEYI